jgi:hypothetical protein
MGDKKKLIIRGLSKKKWTLSIPPYAIDLSVFFADSVH